MYPTMVTDVSRFRPRHECISLCFMDVDIPCRDKKETNLDLSFPLFPSHRNLFSPSSTRPLDQAELKHTHHTVLCSTVLGGTAPADAMRNGGDRFNVANAVVRIVGWSAR